MRLYDLIEKKRDGGEFTDEEINFFIKGYVDGVVPEYQISALIMAIFFRGMNDRELATLTGAMMHSGDIVDLSEFGDLTVDKHSTGGVGDKTSLIVAPIVASLGGIMAKMSGRGLGHTGGTVDKLESIPGFDTGISNDKFLEQVRKVGVAVIGSTKNLAPADKKLYALRDVTATVNSVPLIASSIMSKKLAAGAHNIVLDVKVGSGSFTKTEQEARELAEKMVGIGKSHGRNIAAVMSNMDRPLGFAIGNSVEVLEAVRVLKGDKVDDLYIVCKTLASNLLTLCHGWSIEESEAKVDEVIANGKALETFKEWISAQGGDIAFVDDPSKLGKSEFEIEITAAQDGYISHMNAAEIGKTASVLGAGRETLADVIDRTAGIILKKKTGDAVKKGEVIATFLTSKEEKIETAKEMFAAALEYSTEKPEDKPLVYGIVK